jgi:uncharacterized protein (DUF488 family)
MRVRVMELWTIGYEKASQAEVLRELQAAGVELLVDVRDMPVSRRAGFSKNMLRMSVEAIGIGYVHLKPLGTPKEGRLAHHRGDETAFREIYARQLATPAAQDALQELIGLIAEKRSCLLCFEADWRHCHRARIVEAIEERHPVDAHHLAVEPVFL